MELAPILLLGSGGRVMRPGPEGPVEVRGPADQRVDLFDAVDRLTERYRRLYIVDLEGIEHDTPQLDYLQEITRDTDAWVDAGVTSADGVIDVLVAGARRAVVSTRRLPGPEDLERSLRLSGEVVLEIELGPTGRVAGAASWGEDPRAIAQQARTIGAAGIVISPRVEAIDWSLVTALAAGGPVWVDGIFERAESGSLERSGARGAFFHPDDEMVRSYLPSGPR